MKKCAAVEYIKDQFSKKSSSYHHGNLKEELINQAIEIIHNDGIDTLTLSVLSKRLGTSRSAIYRHFSSKDELIQNVLLYGFEILDQIITPILMQKDKNVEQRLYLMGKSYIKFAQDNPNLYRMLFGEKYYDLREDICTVIDEKFSNAFNALVSLLEEGQRLKDFKEQEPILQALTVHANIHGMSSLYIDGHLNIRDNIDELFEVSFKNLIDGLHFK